MTVIAGHGRREAGQGPEGHPREEPGDRAGRGLREAHTRPNPQRNIKGGIAEREAAIHASNVMIVCGECGKRTRIGHKVLGDGTQGARVPPLRGSAGQVSEKDKDRGRAAARPRAATRPETAAAPRAPAKATPPARGRRPRRRRPRPRRTARAKAEKPAKAAKPAGAPRSRPGSRSATSRRVVPRPDEGAELPQRDGGAAPAQDRGQHGRGRGHPEHQAPRRGHRRARPHHRPAPGHAPLAASRSRPSSSRQGMPIAATVTLRGDRMYEFVDRLFNVALPRVRDFRGVPTERVRRPRQLHAGAEGPAHLPRGRLREGGQDARDERHLRDLGPHATRRASCSSSTSACRSGPVRRVDSGEDVSDRQGGSGRRSSPCASTTAAARAAGLAGTCGSSSSAASASGSRPWPGDIPGVIKASW